MKVQMNIYRSNSMVCPDNICYNISDKFIIIPIASIMILLFQLLFVYMQQLVSSNVQACVVALVLQTTLSN